eukprot:1175570-Prorocentrum_minimum.AAC.3
MDLHGALRARRGLLVRARLRRAAHPGAAPGRAPLGGAGGNGRRGVHPAAQRCAAAPRLELPASNSRFV